MNDRRRVLPSLMLAAALGAAAACPAFGQSAGATDAVLGETFTSRLEGVEFRPPAGGTIQRQLGSGEVVRYSGYPQGWTLVLKDVSNAASLPVGDLVNATVNQLTVGRAGAPAVILRHDLVPVGPRSVGLVEARDQKGTEVVLSQIALIPDGRRYFIVQMLSPRQNDAPPGAPAAAVTAAGLALEQQARQAFQRTLGTFTLTDRRLFAEEQKRRLYNTQQLWVQLDRKRVEAALEPVHFLRIVRDGKDVGYVQVDEQVAQLHKDDGIYVVTREHLLTPAAAAPTPAATPAPGGTVPAAGPRGPLVPTQLDREARFFATFDRAHESWSLQTRLNDSAATDSFELGNSDAVTVRRLNPVALQQGVLARAGNGQAPVVNQDVDTLQVDSYRGSAAAAPTYTTRVDPRNYLPQALAQLLPRVLPVDEPKQYLFAFYVGEQRTVIYRYVDVGVERAVDLDGQSVRAVPIGDRVGADGVVTTHYVDRASGQWLGTSGDDGRLLVLPTNPQSLQASFPAFTALPAPVPPVENEPVRAQYRKDNIQADDLKAPGAAKQMPPALPGQLPPGRSLSGQSDAQPQLPFDSTGIGGR